MRERGCFVGEGGRLGIREVRGLGWRRCGFGLGLVEGEAGQRIGHLHFIKEERRENKENKRK